MANNYLITGYWGEPHVTVENDRGINAAIFGAGRFVLPVGNQFRAEYIGNNTVRVYDGKLIDNGAIAGIPAGQYIDLLIPETGQGMKRNDIIVFQYSKDTATLIESGTFVVIKGAETGGIAADPELTHQDILTDTATFDQMALWRVSVSGSVISAPVQLFEVYNKNVDMTPEQLGAAPTDHSSTGTAYGVGTANKYGHVKLTESFTVSAAGVAAGSKLTAQLHDSVTEISGELDGKAPAYTYGTSDLEAGVSALETGKLYFVYE